MIFKITLDDLLDSNFKFYLDEEFKSRVFSILKQKYKYLGNICKNLDIDRRTLFSIRRGYEYWKGKKVLRFISSKLMKTISEISSIPLLEFEKHIVMIKSGFSGLRDNARLPLEVKLESEHPTNLKRALAEYIYAKKFEDQLSRNTEKLQDSFIKEDNGYLKLNSEVVFKRLQARMHVLKQKGLDPISKISNGSCALEFTNIRNHERIKRIIPLDVTISEAFTKQFGKWLGDNALSENAIAVVNKNWEFITEFQNFLNNVLLQPKNQIELYLSIKDGFTPSNELLQKTTKIRKTSQYGDYAFVTGVYNKLLRNLIFDTITDDWYNVLINSQPKVRFGFYAGLFEADGSVDARSKIILWSFGLNLNITKSQNEIINLLEKVVKFKHLLSLDGFKPNISRKIAKTPKSFTLKYDVTISRNNTTRNEDIKIFQNNILPYMSHEDKVKTFHEVMKSNERN